MTGSLYDEELEGSYADGFLCTQKFLTELVFSQRCGGGWEMLNKRNIYNQYPTSKIVQKCRVSLRTIYWENIPTFKKFGQILPYFMNVCWDCIKLIKKLS